MSDFASPSDDGERRSRAYSSRLSRARAANSERHRLTSNAAVSLAAAKLVVEQDGSMAGMQSPQMETMGRELTMSAATPAPIAAPPTMEQPEAPMSEGQVTLLVQPDDENSAAVFWQWNDEQKFLALVRMAISRRARSCVFCMHVRISLNLANIWMRSHLRLRARNC